DLMNLLCRRIRENKEFVEAIGAEGMSDEELFYAIFPEQVEVGQAKPKTWSWIISRIRDGNDVKPPRNLIDLVKKAQEAQIRREDRSARQYEGGIAIIEAD